jgi:DNA-directed RNA polymerase subunit RPC12/RpoP
MEDPRYVRVVCATCRAVLHPRVEKAGRQVRCPDCYSAVLVPQPPKPEAAPKQRELGEYGVREALAPARSESADANIFLVLCPKCQARLHPRRSHAGRRARCPDCETVFVIPPPPKTEKSKPLPLPGKYAMGEAPKRVEPEFHYLTVDRVREPEPDPLAPPETGWFFRGVFTFPWWPGAWARWTILSLLLVPALFMTGVVLLLAGGSVNQGMTAVPYLMLPLMWLWVWALSYAAGAFVAIVQDTGSSNDEVTSWSEGDWRERVGTMLYVGLHLGLSLAAASAIGWPVGVFTEPLWGAVATGLAANLLFPLFMLSSMEADTLLTPYSPVMFGSLLKTPGGWLIVYIESLLSLALACVLMGAGMYFVPVLTIFLAAPLLAAVIFIEARLYGRLAWHIGQLETKRKRRKRKKRDQTDDRLTGSQRRPRGSPPVKGGS